MQRIYWIERAKRSFNTHGLSQRMLGIKYKLTGIKLLPIECSYNPRKANGLSCNYNINMLSHVVCVV